MKVVDGTFQTSVVANLLGLIEVEVGMLTQLVEGELVDVQLLHSAGIDDEEG